MDLLGHPRHGADLSIPQWDALLRVARKEKLLSRLGAIMADDPRALAACPPQVPPMFLAARGYSRLIQARAGWEVRRLLGATADLGVEFILLKGVGYLHAGLPLARARVFADVDLLVRETELPAVEACLLAAGWEHQQVNDYDQRYYREWMHEIPPLRHRERQMEVDIHHRILPRTSGLAPDPDRLWEASVLVGERLRVLSPPDMVLHCATHLFHDGEIKGGFRDLLDLHQMLVYFGSQDSGFWDALIQRAQILDLERPLYYTVRFCTEFLDTNVPESVRGTVERWAPPAPVDALMGFLVGRVLPPRDIGAHRPAVSEWLLYVRSHWLRMPPWLLAKHLARKALRRLP